LDYATFKEHAIMSQLRH